MRPKYTRVREIGESEDCMGPGEEVEAGMMSRRERWDVFKGARGEQVRQRGARTRQKGACA